VERAGDGREGTAEQQLVEVLTTSRARAQSQWTALRFAAREEEFGEEVLRTIRSKTLDASAAVEIGDGLKQIGAASGALRVYMAAWEAAPEDASVLRNLLDLARSTRDTDLLSAVLERCVKEKIQLSNDLTLREYGIELSQVLENNGDHAGAVDAVASGLDQFPGDQRLGQRLGQLYAKAGAWKEAERVIRQIVDQDPSNGGARQLLCMVYDRQGRYGDSAKLRLEAVPTTDSRVLAALYLAGREDDALAQLERLPVAQLISGTVELSEAALRRGNARLGQLALHLALARVTESGQRFTLKAALLPVTAKLNLAEEYGRLRQSLRSEAARKKSLWLHLLLQERRAALFTNRTATFSSELEAMASGQGPEGSRIPASILIIEEAVRQKNFDQAAVRLRETIAPDRCDWSDFGMVEGRVLKLEVPQLTAELYGERCRRNRADTGLMYEYARSLKAQKRFKEILAAFADTSWRAGEDALPAATHAHELMDLGAWDAARHWTERAWREGTLSQPGLTRSALARQALHRGDRAGAERWLRMAAKDRTLDDGRAFAEYLSTEPDVAQGMDWMRSIGCRPGLILATWRKLFTNAAEGDTVSRMAPLIKAAPHSLETAQAEALRTMAQRTGAWNELAEMVRLTPLAPLAETRAELLLLFSDAAKHAGNYALSADHALAAAQLAPMRWTCVTTAVEALRADGKPEQAAVVLDRYMLLVRDLERENAWALAVTLPSVPSNR
jgi:tetratricopeptide (TPR) repeat protein